MIRNWMRRSTRLTPPLRLWKTGAGETGTAAAPAAAAGPGGTAGSLPGADAGGSGLAGPSSPPSHRVGLYRGAV